MSLEENKGFTGSDFVGEQTELEKSQPAVPFNEELANRVAENARKLILGDISEAEFYHKHHESYLKEFGLDERPVSPVENKNVTQSESSLTKTMSRRTLLKAGGMALASVLGAKLLGGPGSKAMAAGTPAGTNLSSLLLKKTEAESQSAKGVQMGLVIDLEACDGCLSCVYACQSHNFNSTGVFWIYVLAFKDINREEDNFLIRMCQHCANPPCVKVCPVRARHKRDKDGLVLTDYSLCIGCRYCMVTCPYGANYFQWDLPDKKNYYHEKVTDARGKWVIGNPPKGCMGKCTFCPDRQDDGRKNLVCSLVCPRNVLHFGDMNDPNSEPLRYLAQRTKEAGGKLSTFRLLENQGTKPSIIYIGQQPTRAAKPVDGPVTYSDWGLVEKRMDVLEGPKPWFINAFGGGK